MGRALLPAPFFATVVLGGLTVLDAGSDAQKQDILTGVCAGHRPPYPGPHRAVGHHRGMGR